MRYVCVFFILVISFSCKKQGCTNPTALNYSLEAEKEDESCVFEKFYTLYIMQDVAEQYQNDGVIGFIIQSLDNLAKPEVQGIYKYIDINNCPIGFPECGQGVWSYSETSRNENHHFYYEHVQLSKVTLVDTTFIQWVSPTYLKELDGPCNRRPIYY